MATHSSILVWRIPMQEEPVRLQSIRCHVGHSWVTRHNFKNRAVVPSTLPLHSCFLSYIIDLKWNYCTIVLHTVLYSKVHKCTTTCLGSAHKNVCQICELTVLIAHANALLHAWKFSTWGFVCTDLLHRFSVNVCSEGKREASKDLPVISIFACVMATLNRNSIEHNWGLVYGNIAASERGPGSQEVGKEPWFIEKSQKCKRGESNFSLVFVKDSANIILICL